MRLLAIDPSYSERKGRMTGLAYFKDDALVSFRYLTAADVRDTTIRIGWLARAHTLAIEAQHFQHNAAVLIGLVEAKCRWTVPAEDRGMEVIELQPSAWISAAQRGWKRGAKKDLAAIEQYVRLRWGLKDFIQADALAAICIGTCAIDRAVRNGARRR